MPDLSFNDVFCFASPKVTHRHVFMLIEGRRIMQSCTMSFVEAAANVIVGYGIAVATQMTIFPWFGLHATLDENLTMGLIFTVVSLIRSYTLRRLFNQN
jgi:hypothetical protein